MKYAKAAVILSTIAYALLITGCGTVDSGAEFTGPWYERVETGPFEASMGGGPCFMDSDPCVTWPAADGPAVDLRVSVIVEHWMEGDLDWTMVRMREARIDGYTFRDTVGVHTVHLTPRTGNTYVDEGTGECFRIQRTRTLRIVSCGTSGKPLIDITGES